MITVRRWWPSTIRVRLTLLYAGSFFLAGAVLVAVMYFILGEALDRQVTARVGITEHLPESTTGSQQAAHEAQEALRAQFEQDRDDTLNIMLIASLVALGGVGVTAGGLGWLVAGRALHPLQQITATARRVADRSLHERIALAGPDDEIKDLADIARRITTESQGAAQNAHVDIRTHLQSAPVDGDPVLLERLTQNLVDNAIRYNLPEDGWIAVTTDLVDRNVHLTVENTGQRIPPYEVPSLFEPFRRLPTTERLADSAKSSISRGAGLGLSIVRSVARAHRGNVDASSREDGGLIVGVRIPAASKKSIRNHV